MFSSSHFIWLGIIFAIIVTALVVIKKRNIPTKAVQKTVLFLLVILKLFHMALSMKEMPDGSYVLNQTQLSFHL